MDRPPPARTDDDAPTPPERARAAAGARARRAFGWAIGLALLGAALWALLRQREVAAQALSATREAGWVPIAALAALILASWLLTSWMYWILTGRYGRVGAREMAALIGSAWLLNLLPMRPGLVGRVAYHRAFNGIRARDSVVVVLTAAACSAVCVCLLIVALGAARLLPGSLLGVALGAPAAVLAVGAMVSRRRAGAGGGGGGASARRAWLATDPWRLWAALLVRYLDVLGWTARYALLFWMTGRPLDALGAATVAAASQAAMLAPVQLGVREWVVGIVAGLLPAAHGGAGAALGGELLPALAPGLAADVVNRGAEVALAAPVGLASMWWLWRRRLGAPAHGPGATRGAE